MSANFGLLSLFLVAESEIAMYFFLLDRSDIGSDLLGSGDYIPNFPAKSVIPGLQNPY